MAKKKVIKKKIGTVVENIPEVIDTKKFQRVKGVYYQRPTNYQIGDSGFMEHVPDIDNYPNQD
jgi:hypothetical protein